MTTGPRLEVYTRLRKGELNANRDAPLHAP